MKKIKLKGWFIVILIVIVFINVFIFYNTYNYDKYKEETYNRLLGPVAEYLQSKYDEKMTIKDEFSFTEGVATFFATPVNNSEIEFKIIDWGDSRGGFRDDYLESYAEWEAECIIDSVVEKYCNNFICYTILTLTVRFAEVGMLEEYYMEYKEHLDWQEYFGKLYFAGIRIHGYDENLVKQNVIEPVLSDLIKLDFVIENVTFYLYEKEGDQNESTTYQYQYKSGEFHLIEKE